MILGPSEQLAAVLRSLESICASCMAATSQETWDYLHTRPGSLATCRRTAQIAGAMMRRAVAAYARHGRLIG